MKVTLNWLKQYVDFDWSPEQPSERLTMLGIEVEGVVMRRYTFDDDRLFFENVVLVLRQP